MVRIRGQYIIFATSHTPLVQHATRIIPSQSSHLLLLLVKSTYVRLFDKDAVYLADLQTDETITIRDAQEMIDNVQQKVDGMKGDYMTAAKTLLRLLEERITGCVPNSLLLRALGDIGFAGKGQDWRRAERTGLPGLLCHRDGEDSRRPSTGAHR